VSSGTWLPERTADLDASMFQFLASIGAVEQDARRAGAGRCPNPKRRPTAGPKGEVMLFSQASASTTTTILDTISASRHRRRHQRQRQVARRAHVRR